MGVRSSCTISLALVSRDTIDFHVEHPSYERIHWEAPFYGYALQAFQALRKGLQHTFPLSQRDITYISDATQEKFSIETSSEEAPYLALQERLDNLFCTAIPSQNDIEARFKEKEFLRRIPPKERQAISGKLYDKEPLSAEHLRALKEGEWSHDLFRLPDWPILVFQAYLNNQIGEMQASKLFLYDQCHLESDHVESYQLVNAHGERDRQAFEMFKLGIRFIAKERTDAVTEAIAQLPPQEGQFFVACPRHLWPVDPSSKKDVVQALFERRSWEYCIWGHAKKGKQYIGLVVLPPALNYKILLEVYRENAMSPLPVLGHFSKEKLSDPRQRVCGVPCRYVTGTGVADGYSASGLTFHYHDAGVHLVEDSANPHREAWTELGYMIQKPFPTSYVPFFDRDFPLYVDFKAPEEVIFWFSLVKVLRLIAEEGARLFSTATSKSKKERPQVFQQKTQELWVQMGSVCLDHILAHEEKWLEKYKLDFLSLHEACDSSHKEGLPKHLAHFEDVRGQFSILQAWTRDFVRRLEEKKAQKSVENVL